MTTVPPCPWEARSAIDQSDGDWTLNSTRIRSVLALHQHKARHFPIIMISPLNVSSPLWLLLFAMRSQMWVLLGFLYVWQVMPLLLFSRIVFVFQHFYMNCQGVDIILPSVEFTDFCGCVDECFPSTWEFPVMISLNNFYSPFSLSCLSATHVTRMLVSLCHAFLWVSVYFFRSSFLSTDCTASVNQLFSWFFGQFQVYCWIPLVNFSFQSYFSSSEFSCGSFVFFNNFSLYPLRDETLLTFLYFLSMVCFSFFNVFIRVALKPLSIKSNIWAPWQAVPVTRSVSPCVCHTFQCMSPVFFVVVIVENWTF